MKMDVTANHIVFANSCVPEKHEVMHHYEVAVKCPVFIFHTDGSSDYEHSGSVSRNDLISELTTA